MYITNSGLSKLRPFIKFYMTHYNSESIQKYNGYMSSGQHLCIWNNDQTLVAEVIYIKKHWWSIPVMKIKTYSGKYNEIDITDLLREKE